MADNTVYVRASSDGLRRVLESIPEQMQGGGPLASAMLTRCGLAALGRIKTAFVAKARGGTDEAGDRWAPLKPSTIAYSRRGRSRAEKKQANRPSQALNRRQQDRWWSLYRQGLAMFRGDKGRAAKRAWGISKAEGATTLLAKYGGRKVEILRDTGVLLNSLSPGVGSGNQVLRVGRGEVVVGTNVPYARFHHERTRRIPQRRLWPEPSRWPSSWWRDILEQARAGVLDIAAQLIGGAK